MPTKYTPRLSVEITPEQLAALQELFEFGLLKTVYGVITDEVIRLMRTNKPAFISAIYQKKITLEQIVGM